MRGEVCLFKLHNYRCIIYRQLKRIYSGFVLDQVLPVLVAMYVPLDVTGSEIVAAIVGLNWRKRMFAFDDKRRKKLCDCAELAIDMLEIVMRITEIVLVLVNTDATV